MKSFLARKLYGYVATHRQSTITRMLMRLSYLVRDAYFNSSNHDIRTNGEARALEGCYRLQREADRADQPFVIFDVGANEGDWTLVASDVCPGSQIHLFEVVPDTREILKKNLGQRENLFINETGLSDAEKTLEIKYYPDANTGSSEYDLPWGAQHVMIQAKCLPGDQYMRENEIEHIHFLKIDVEGGDYKVLQGFQRALQENRIDGIQFEYNKAAAISKIMLKDFYDLLGGYGFEIGRVLPNAVDFKAYDLFQDENLLQSNFFAIRKELRSRFENVS